MRTKRKEEPGLVSLLPCQLPADNGMFAIPAKAGMPSAPRLSEKTPPPVTASHTTAQPAQQTAFDLKGKRVVVVEDEGMTQLQLRRILRAEGLEVVGTASNGKEAAEVVLKQRPDLVLMDIRMPIMDGLEAARQILKDYRVCIVMLTAFSEEEYWQAAQEIGACGYILKPVTSELLIPQLAAALQKYSQQ